ncbi:MAG: SDR family oxidoreductase [Gemmatimonadales bacterium]|nr:SDR family oxidoreductase [Gemmatimonadales bacterium]NIN10513.1 SDR family oxidoreductase [Gemmatimonadales bacterium]NIN49300.1 SDR family oxidoreductase [Gemmatimonadales bacterium]NIP06764.1 SDR family oxidoreductase [Gemmatimonadales bacterium]NIR02790.1 SDR family oxidoreductase [Gemmatimonadales bacterium]
MENVLIVGATSAIAQETAKCFARSGAALFLVGRSPDKLQAVADDLSVRGASKVGSLAVDLTQTTRHPEILQGARAFLGRIDGVLIAHGTLPAQERAERDREYAADALEVNLVSPVSILTVLSSYFYEQGTGCIAVITSVAGDRGRRSNYVYGAAKGGLARFLEGLRARLAPAGVRVLTVKPGLVDTPMTAHLPKNLLFASAERVGKRIHRAMLRGQAVVYIPWYWRWIMLVLRSIPEPFFRRLPL